MLQRTLEFLTYTAKSKWGGFDKETELFETGEQTKEQEQDSRGFPGHLEIIGTFHITHSST